MPTKLGPRITLVKDDLPRLKDAIRRLADTHVMVGIPRETTKRDDGSEFTNAEIGYVQEHGAPETNLPPRPHLYPTVRDAKPLIAQQLKIAGRAALSNDLPKMERTLEGLGLRVMTLVRRRIVAVIPPPLAPATVAGRIARRKSGRWRAQRRALIAANIAAGTTITDVTGATQTATEDTPGVGVFTPLVDTGNYLAHITYVVRSRRTRQDKKVGPVGKWQKGT